MNSKILNYVIAISIIGISIISIKDYLTELNTKKIIEAKKTTYKQNIQPTNIPEKIKETKEIPCVNKFFSFKKGTSWDYKVSVDYKILNNKQNTTEYFTNKIVATSSSTITIETTYKDKKEKDTTIIYCKEDGLHNIPFPMLNKISTLLIPPDTLITKGNFWNNYLTINLPFKLPISISIPDIDLSLKNNVYKIIDKTVEIYVDVGINTAIPIKTTDRFFRYTLEEKKGISYLGIEYTFPEIGFFKTNLQLTKFTP